MTSSSVNPLAVPADGHFWRQRIVGAAPRARRDGAPASCVDGVIRNARGRGCLPIDTISLAGGQCHRRRRLQRHYHGIRHEAGMNRQKCGGHSSHFRKCGPVGLRSKPWDTGIAVPPYDRLRGSCSGRAVSRQGCLAGQSDRRRIGEDRRRARIVGNAKAGGERDVDQDGPEAAVCQAQPSPFADTNALRCQIVSAMNDPARPSGSASVPPPGMVADAFVPA